MTAWAKSSSQDTTLLWGDGGGVGIPSTSAWNVKGKAGSADKVADIMEGHEPDGKKNKTKQRKSSCRPAEMFEGCFLREDLDS